MGGRAFRMAGILGVIGAAAIAQPMERRANITGGGNPGEGRCTIEVVVDGAAEVEIRGDRALLRTLSGRPPQWRRFQCNVPLTGNPLDFRFKGIDGRGLQELIREPGRGGPAVVRIEDHDGGDERYIFEIIWRGAGYLPPGRPGPGRSGRLSVDDAVRACQDAVRERALDQMRNSRIEFRRTAIDDNPGRQDWVIGTFEAFRGNGRGRSDLYRFSCSVDFSSGRVRSADFQRMDRR